MVGIEQVGPGDVLAVNTSRPGFQFAAIFSRLVRLFERIAGMFDALRLHDLSHEIDHLWRWPTASGQLPGHVVCSSLAACLYGLAGWATPSRPDVRTCEPADWWVWSDRRQWEDGT